MSARKMGFAVRGPKYSGERRHAYKHGESTTPDAFGIPCPDCDETVRRVLDTRARAGGNIYRRVECPNGHRYATTETLVDRLSQDRRITGGVRQALTDRLDDVLTAPTPVSD